MVLLGTRVERCCPSLVSFYLTSWVSLILAIIQSTHFSESVPASLKTTVKNPIQTQSDAHPANLNSICPISNLLFNFHSISYFLPLHPFHPMYILFPHHPHFNAPSIYIYLFGLSHLAWIFDKSKLATKDRQHDNLLCEKRVRCHLIIKQV